MHTKGAYIYIYILKVLLKKMDLFKGLSIVKILEKPKKWLSWALPNPLTHSR